jgi:hypothetical protein
VTDQEQRLRTTFETVRSEAPPEEPDWLDVVRRAQDVPTFRPTRRASRPVLIAATLAIFAGILALPPIGLGSRLVDLVQPTPPVKLVRNQFASMNRFAKGRAILAKTRKLTTITQYRRSISLWVAPTKQGGACYLVLGRNGSEGSCLGPQMYRLGLDVSLGGLGAPPPKAGVSGTLGSGPELGPSVALLAGHAGNAARVELHYADGAQTVLPLTEGWFLFAVSLANLRPGHRPVSLVSLDASGKVLHKETQLFAPHVRIVRETPVAASKRKLQTTALPGGVRAVLWTARSKQGNECLAVLVDGLSKQFPGWNCGHVVGRRLHEFGVAGGIRNSRLHWEPSAGGDPPNALPIAAGWAAAPIVRLRVRYADGTTSPLALHDRLFLYLVPVRNRLAGHTPSRLEGLDASGNVVQTLRIDKRRCARGVHWTCPFPG